MKSEKRKMKGKNKKMQPKSKIIVHCQLSIVNFSLPLRSVLKDRPADMAQLVEQRIRNAWVRGSSPRVGSSVEQLADAYLRSVCVCRFYQACATL